MARGDQLARQWRIIQTLISTRGGRAVGWNTSAPLQERIVFDDTRGAPFALLDQLYSTQLMAWGGTPPPMGGIYALLRQASSGLEERLSQV